MEALIITLIGLPLVGFLISMFIPSKQEDAIATCVKLVTGLQFIVSLVFVGYWMYNGMKDINIHELSVFKTSDYDFYVDFFADKLTVVYLLFGSFLIFLIGLFSRRYLHRETGYKRFFNVFLFFAFGYTLIIFSGNFETMFIGWEVLGISSFLLIGFYRDRYLPVKNAVKVFSIYRIGDVGLILAMWLSHHLWGENIAFHKLEVVKSLHDTLTHHSSEAIAISVLIFIAAAAKSALLPFSSWLPRAMEGPTPSSAIFYGSLSVHIGAFLMIRTMPYWIDLVEVRIFIGSVGLLTAIIANFTARVQSSIKSQIGYGSIAQIGLIFIEIAAGFEILALIHISANAFYRTYQLLISPSIVTYKIREQMYHFAPKKNTIEDSWPKRLEYTLYLLSLKEWNLDNALYRYLWIPLKKFGGMLSFLSIRRVAYFFIPVFGSGLILYANHSFLPKNVLIAFPLFFGFLGLLMVLKSFTERRNVFTAFTLVGLNQACIVLAIAFNEELSFAEIMCFVSGIVIAGIIGMASLLRLKKLEKSISLDAFHGNVYEHPKITLVFFIACLAMAGFPITPTFIGEDLLFSHIKEDQLFLAALVAISFVVDGLALIRIYSRVFLGPHHKTYHEVAKRSS